MKQLGDAMSLDASAPPLDLTALNHAIATLEWFLHPLLPMLATTGVLFILARRDHFSRTLRLISASLVPASLVRPLGRAGAMP